MPRGWAASILVVATLSVGPVHAGAFDPPDPRVFARAEDRQRARLLMKPCVEADVGRGCHRYDGRLIREAPCSYHIDARTLGSLPTDRCYKMEAPRLHRGVWIDAFEGQRFIPEGTNPPDWPRTAPGSPGSGEQAERARMATIWIDIRGVDLGPTTRRRGATWFIEFVGRKTMYPGAYGHFGMSGEEIVVDRVMSLRPCPAAGVCR